MYSDGKTYGIPDDYIIEYKDGNQWKQVNATNRNPSIPIGNTVNTVVFEKIALDQIRINFKHKAKGLAVALAEMECY